MKDYLTKRDINIKEKVLVVHDRFYASESYIAVDTRKLEGFPPKVYYDKHHNLLGKMYEKGIFELDDIEDILLSYEDTCFSNHDLDDLRKFLIKRREDFYKSFEKNQNNIDTWLNSW
ncbi:aspartate 1-decarboxylase (aspartate alpha-decarboxylase) [Anaerococcus sp. AGMB00486]|uniref:Aspartate 1-decarboxylase (Aspartate alpha-decarboxylase) n=1 Tax=Anaerococcus faecalis TaxID=2742993 RepID=A0ABX2N7P3_9FIRM|nr:aspartate 1-decarboxylase (aspartate alpha-decarboxylase) [Anaerococcus faecalis]NVF10695.1 aspartate 1-decarboxylase (aspartate alpha-decarboxylase) [Anaerococcus faecalis]